MSNSLQPASHTESESEHSWTRPYQYVFLLIFLYRHTQEMIEKLESAGLGFYVKATETQQKLG